MFCQPDEKEPFEKKVDKDSSKDYRKDSRAYSEDLGLSLKLAKILDVSDTTMRRRESTLQILCDKNLTNALRCQDEQSCSL